jgi:hypothetical protein
LGSGQSGQTATRTGSTSSTDTQGAELPDPMLALHSDRINPEMLWRSVRAPKQ